MPKREKVPPIKNAPKLITVWNPWPADLRYDEKILDEKAAIKFVQWVSSIAEDNGAVLAILYKPKASCVVLEMSDDFHAYERLLGSHRWVDEIQHLDAFDRTGESKFFFAAAANSYDLRKQNWKEKVPASEWLDDFDPLNNDIVKRPYPKSEWCDIPTKSMIVGDPNTYCKPLPSYYFPEYREAEQRAAEKAAEDRVKAPAHIPGTAAYFETKGSGKPMPDFKPNGPCGKKQKAKPKTLNVGAASKKGLPSQFPKKEPPRDFFPQEQALRQVLGTGSRTSPSVPTSTPSASNFTSPDLDGSIASSTTEPFDWAEEMDREDREKEQIDQVAAAATAPTWGGEATWPGWDDDDDDDEGDSYASMSAAREFAYGTAGIAGNPTSEERRAGGWGEVEPSWDNESVVSEKESPPTPVKTANAPPGKGNVWVKPAPASAPTKGSWSRNLSSSQTPATTQDAAKTADDGWNTVSPKAPPAKPATRSGRGGHRGGHRGGATRGGVQRGSARK
ncbi:hypothetical protein FRB98_002188 [Tulasnella sp. 332]|nr:hypothetical protein FRB98_002188 [Tulasnella sp. 332]